MSPKASNRRQRPLPTGETMYTPGASPTRQGIERRSAVPLAFLYRLPRWLPPIALAALFVGGLALGGAGGAVLLLVLAAFLGWLGYLSWPSLGTQGRLLRVAADAVLIAIAVAQILTAR